MKRLFLVMLCFLPNAVVAGEPTPQRQAELLHLLRHDCGACHGMTLKGGLGPPLLPARLARMPRQTLKATLQYGRLGTPMPPWRGLLTDAEIDWLLDVLYEGVADGP